MSAKFSVCIEMIFGEVPFIERIDEVAKSGLDAFEFWGWQEKDLEAINEKCSETGLDLAAITAGNVVLTDPEQIEETVDQIKKSIKTAKEIKSQNIIITVGQELEAYDRSVQHQNIVQVLKEVAPAAEKAEIMLVVEPLNTAVDHIGYYLSSSREGYEIVNEVNSEAVRLLFDIYHQQITEGNLIDNIKEHIGLIGHFHLADVPGRHEPGTGELNYRNILSAITDTDYDRYVGCEFRPEQSSREALEDFKRIIEE